MQQKKIRFGSPIIFSAFNRFIFFTIRLPHKIEFIFYRACFRARYYRAAFLAVSVTISHC